MKLAVPEVVKVTAEVAPRGGARIETRSGHTR